MKAGDDFRFTLRDVERRALFRLHPRSDISGKWEQRNKKPVEHAKVAALAVDNLDQIQALRRHQHADERETHRDS